MRISVCNKIHSPLVFTFNNTFSGASHPLVYFCCIRLMFSSFVFVFVKGYCTIATLPTQLFSSLSFRSMFKLKLTIYLKHVCLVKYCSTSSNKLQYYYYQGPRYILLLVTLEGAIILFIYTTHRSQYQERNRTFVASNICKSNENSKLYPLLCIHTDIK